jgi:hypothetical protein
MSTNDFTTQPESSPTTTTSKGKERSQTKCKEHSAYAAKWAEALSDIAADWKERGILDKATLNVRPFDAAKDHCQNTDLSVWAKKEEESTNDE